MMPIPFLDLTRQLAAIRPEVDDCLRRVLDGGNFILGQEGAAFEAEFAAHHRARFAAGVGNGTDALALALRASGRIVPGEGHEVVTTALTAGFTALGILMAGGVPVFADVLPDTLLIDPASVDALVGPKTRALLPVHLYGRSCDLDAMRGISDVHKLFLLEDCSQSHGTRFGNRYTGTVGDAGTFSFYPTKNLGAYGDGGLILTDQEELIERVRRLRRGGIGSAGLHVDAGINSRLDEIHAAVLRLKLGRLEGWNQRRIQLARRYDRGLEGTRACPCVPASTVEIGESNYHLYVIRHGERDRLQEFLRERGIQALVHYPVPLHRHDAFRAYARTDHVPRVAEAACREILSLPLYPEFTEDEQDQVLAAIREFDGTT